MIEDKDKDNDKVGMDRKTVVVGSDHAAFSMKETIKKFLESQCFNVVDVGTDSLDSVNYAVYGAKVALSISTKKYERGILLCGTGIGMSMVANRYPHVRAALCGGIFSAKMSRLHNDANILVMGGRVTGDILATEIAYTFLTTKFEGGRHQERLSYFDKI